MRACITVSFHAYRKDGRGNQRKGNYRVRSVCIPHFIFASHIKIILARMELVAIYKRGECRSVHIQRSRHCSVGDSGSG